MYDGDMAWDTERTRTLLLDAATAEFSATGLAGARIDRIATAAGVNKERIYSYFGNKDGLFEAVLRRELDDVLRGDVAIDGTGPSAFADYVDGLVERYERHPHLPRLLAWEGLERRSDPLAHDARRPSCIGKVEAIERVLPGIDPADAEHLLLSALTLAGGIWALPQMAVLICGAEEASGVDERRSALRKQAAALAQSFLPAAEEHSGAGVG